MRFLTTITFLFIFVLSHAQIRSLGTASSDDPPVIQKLGGGKFKITVTSNSLRDPTKIDLDKAPLSWIEPTVKKEVEFINTNEKKIEQFSQTDYPLDTGPVLYASGAVDKYGYRDVMSVDINSSASLEKEKTAWDVAVEKGVEEARRYFERAVKKEIKNAVKNEIGNALGNQLGGLGGQLAGDILFGNAQKKEEEAAKREALKEQIAINDHYLMKYKLMPQFEEILEDFPISVVATKPVTYFFVANIEHSYGISFSLFDLKPNGYNQLPYKVDVLKQYKKDTGREENYLYGPFGSLDEARDRIDEIARTAYLAFWKVAPDVGFSYGSGDVATQQATSGADFWGSSKKAGAAPPPEKKKEEAASADFWGVKKKDN